MGDGSVASMADNRIPVAQGWLAKRGPSFEFKWEKRWCAVYGVDKSAAASSEARFVYYRSDSEDDVQNEPLGKISLQAKTVAWPITKMEAPGDSAKHSSKRPFAFVLDENSGGGKSRRLYYFDAIDAEQLNRWISSISQIVAALQGDFVPTYLSDLDQQKKRISVLLEGMQASDSSKPTPQPSVTQKQADQDRQQRISVLRSQAKKRISEAHQGGRLEGVSASIARSSILETSSKEAPPPAADANDRQQRLSLLRSQAKKRISEAHKDGKLHGQISSAIGRASVIIGEPLSDSKKQEASVTSSQSVDSKEQRIQTLRSKAGARLRQASEDGTLREHCTKRASLAQMEEANAASAKLQPSAAGVAKGQRASILAEKRASILSTNPRLSILKNVAKSRLSQTLNDGSLKDRLAAMEVRREERRSILGGSLPEMAFGRQPTTKTNPTKELARKGEARHHLLGEEHLEDYQVDRTKGLQTRELIIAAMKHDRITMLLDSNEIDMILRTMQYYSLNPDDVVVKEGEVGNHFFVAHSGSLEVSVDGKPRDTISSGGSFGALALLYKCPRTATITAKAASGLWGADGKTFNKVLQEHTEKHRAAYRKFLQSVPLLEAVPDRHMDHILDATTEEVIEPGARVVTEGGPMTALYVVRKGLLKIVKGGTMGTDGVLVGGEEIGTLRPGDHFGERALLYSEPRSSTVIAVNESDLLCLAASKLEESLGADLRTCLEWYQVRTGLLKSQSLSRLPLTERSACSQKVVVREIASTEEIDEHFMCLIVVSGEITVTSSNGATLSASTGSCVDGLFSKIEVPYTITAEGGPARIGILSLASLAEVLRLEPKTTATQIESYMKKLLLVVNVPLFQNLPHSIINDVVKAIDHEVFKKERRVFEQNTPGSKFYIMGSGEAKVIIDGEVKCTLQQNDWFGERAMLFNEKRVATVEITSEEADVWSLDKWAFEDVLKGGLREEMMNRVGITQKITIPKKLKDLKLIKVIAITTHSDVRIVENKHGARYCLKRAPLTKRKALGEFQMLVDHAHPFVMRTVTSFETKRSCYLLSELIPGGTLRQAMTVLSRALRVSELQFYIGTLTLIIEYFIDKQIAYRDLKPENVMLDAQGYVKLIDFDLAKHFLPAQTRTFSMVGTPHYMAPEVIRGRGYGMEVDLWSLGVMTYELAYDKLPFVGSDTSEICKAVLQGEYTFPDEAGESSPDVKSLKSFIAALLCKDPKKRLGAGLTASSSIAALHGHEFFKVDLSDSQDTLLDKILGRELPAPYVSSREQFPDASGVDVDLSDGEEFFK